LEIPLKLILYSENIFVGNCGAPQLPTKTIERYINTSASV